MTHKAHDGEKHIADVKTEEGWVLEFQHTYLNPEERRARNDFYNNLVWVINGARRKRDGLQFHQVISKGIVVSKRPPIYRIVSSNNCRLLTEWNGYNGPVLFDFQGDDLNINNPTLWFLIPGTFKQGSYIITSKKQDFIKLHLDKEFSKILQNITNAVSCKAA